MKTRCYCVGCKLHPLHDKRHEFSSWVTGFTGSHTIYKPDEYNQGADVECLNPISDAFGELFIEPEDLEFPVTAYGDGASITFAMGRMFEICANCDDEDHED